MMMFNNKELKYKIKYMLKKKNMNRNTIYTYLYKYAIRKLPTTYNASWLVAS